MGGLCPPVFQVPSHSIHLFSFTPFRIENAQSNVVFSVIYAHESGRFTPFRIENAQSNVAFSVIYAHFRGRFK